MLKLFLLLSSLIVLTTTSDEYSDTVIKLLVYPGQDAPMLDTNVLNNAFKKQYQIPSKTTRLPKPKITILEEILNAVLDKKKKQLRNLLNKTNSKYKNPNNYQSPRQPTPRLPTYQYFHPQPPSQCI